MAVCRDAEFVRWAQRQPTESCSREPGSLGSALVEGWVGAGQRDAWQGESDRDTAGTRGAILLRLQLRDPSQLYWHVGLDFRLGDD